MIPFHELTAEQLDAAGQRWDMTKLGGYDYQFAKDGAALARRKSQAAAPKAKAAPAVKTKAPAADPKPEKKPAAPKASKPKKETPATKKAEAAAADVAATTAVDFAGEVVAAVAGAPGISAETLAESIPAIADPANMAEDLAGGELSAKAAGEATPAQSAPSPRQAAAIVLVPLVCLIDSPTQPRTHYDQAEHEELTASMRAHGWLESMPALLRPLDGPAVLAAPVDPSLPEGAWHLIEPETRKDLALGKLTKDEAEELAATKYATRYEIVFAHRRTRAARAAGLAEAPAVIRTLSDVAVLELQLIENLQRSDLNPVEEAEQLARLLALRDASGRPLHTKETLAKRLGKTTEHVRQYATLCRLDGEARDAVSAGVIGAQIAVALARIPDSETRAKAAKEILNPTQGEGPMRAKAAFDYIRRECTRNLRTEAKFDAADAELVAVRFRFDPETPEETERYFGGACLDCPFNSVNSGEEGKRGPKLGVCSNLACFDAKQTAGFEKWRAEHNQPEKGKVAVTPERNAEIFDAEGEIDWQSGLVELTDTPDAGLLKADAEIGEKTWKELTKGKLSTVYVARHPSGKRVEVIEIEAAKAAAELNGHKQFKTSKADRIPHTTKGDETHRTQTLEKKDNQESRRRVETLFFGEVAHKAQATEHLPPAALSAVARWVAGIVTLPVLETVAKRRGLDPAALANIATHGTAPEQIGLVCELVVADHYKADCVDLAAEFAGAFGISLDEIRERVRREASQPAPSPAPAPAEAAAPTPELALPEGENWRALRYSRTKFEFEFDEHGDATRPDAIAVLIPSLSIHLHAACIINADVETWFAGYELNGGRLAAASPCSNKGTGYPTRFTAFAVAARDVAARLDAEETASPAAREMMRSVAESMRDFAGAEIYTRNESGEIDALALLPEPAPEPEANFIDVETPTHLAYVTVAGASFRKPIVKTYDHAEYLEFLASPGIAWLCPLIGCSNYEIAEDGATEALEAGAGQITQAGEQVGFAFNQEAAK